VSGLLWLHTDGEIPRGGTGALDDFFDTDVLTIAAERHWSGSLCIEYRPKQQAVTLNGFLDMRILQRCSNWGLQGSILREATYTG